MIQAIFFDIDGTLVPHGKNDMPESTKKALKALKKKGIKLFIATGRPANSIDHVKAMFDFDGFLTANGQYCFNNETLIYEKYIEKESIQQVIPYVEENKIGIIYASLEDCYRNQYIKNEFEYRRPLVNYDTLLNNNIVQIMVYINEEQDEEFLNHLPGCKSARWSPLFADIIPSDGGKDQGINKIIDYYNIPLSNVMACGDGGNDITMLKHVPNSVAMGNANDEVKKHADFVTTDIEDDGILNACIHYGVLKREEIEL